TGTLTQAHPEVANVEAYGGYTKEQVLTLSACLEEHFPHPVARAVVNKAFELNLPHRELHSDVQYIVAHGIVSSLDGERVVIGSQHFVIEDEKVPITDEELEAIHAAGEGTSPLFLAVSGQLRGIIYIDDPLKPHVRDVIEELRQEGFKKVIMLTGDNDKTAKLVAEEAGVDDYKADLLPEDKHRIVHELQEQGYKVAMVGDGVNDGPALAEAYVSIAMSNGSAVAREAADISLVSNNIHHIVDLRKLSVELAVRMNHGYMFTMIFNSLLLALGIFGVLTPQLASVFHNGSTVGLSLWNSRQFLPGVLPEEGTLIDEPEDEEIYPDTPPLAAEEAQWQEEEDEGLD
ncbi:MAG: HAD-IC family P-type ATPase, partial [Eggerthellaceae bacterium]|nr:HAD-IC family P-type ATPase [Eggerthellaceae bacterium]